jgi:hypothetical protein
VGKVPELAYAEKAVMGSVSFDVKVTMTVWVVPTATASESTEAVADTLLWFPGATGPLGPTFGGVTGGVAVPPLVDVGATLPLWLPNELEPQALKSGIDKTPRRIKRWPSSIFPHLETSVVPIKRRGPATK